jgi:hypothetical protein
MIVQKKKTTLTYSTRSDGLTKAMLTADAGSQTFPAKIGMIDMKLDIPPAIESACSVTYSWLSMLARKNVPNLASRQRNLCLSSKPKEVS